MSQAQNAAKEASDWADTSTCFEHSSAARSRAQETYSDTAEVRRSCRHACEWAEKYCVFPPTPKHALSTPSQWKMNNEWLTASGLDRSGQAAVCSCTEVACPVRTNLPSTNTACRGAGALCLVVKTAAVHGHGNTKLKLCLTRYEHLSCCRLDMP